MAWTASNPSRPKLFSYLWAILLAKQALVFLDPAVRTDMALMVVELSDRSVCSGNQFTSTFTRNQPLRTFKSAVTMRSNRYNISGKAEVKERKLWDTGRKHYLHEFLWHHFFFKSTKILHKTQKSGSQCTAIWPWHSSEFHHHWSSLHIKKKYYILRSDISMGPLKAFSTIIFIIMQWLPLLSLKSYSQQDMKARVTKDTRN